MPDLNYENDYEVNKNGNIYKVESSYSGKKTALEIICELLSSKFRDV